MGTNVISTMTMTITMVINIPDKALNEFFEKVGI